MTRSYAVVGGIELMNITLIGIALIYMRHHGIDVGGLENYGAQDEPHYTAALSCLVGA